MEKRDLICVSCPIGCAVTVELDDNGQVLSVTGNTCKRGDSYARQECNSSDNTSHSVERRQNACSTRQIRETDSERIAV